MPVEFSSRDDELRFERDLQIAREIQRGFLPPELPQFTGWQIAAQFLPAYEVAGDFYDAFYLTNKTRLGFVVADVCDKGIGAALFMGLARSLLRAFAQQNYTVNWAEVIGTDTLGRRGQKLGKTGVGVTALKNAVTLTNNYIASNHGQSNMFATLFFGILDPETGAVNYVNAGHNPPLVVGPDGGIKARLTRTGVAVGMFPDMEFGIEAAQLDPGDTLLAFTDGVTEAKNAQDELFSDERLESLTASAPPSAEGLLRHIQAAVNAHVGGASQSDDITLLAIRRETAV
jgi:sigma-B regulation protein RsbU (phosphoserine phosphatase)